MALPERMKKFAHAKLQGKSNKDAAILAGYSERSAASRGAQLADDSRVVEYLAAALKQGGAGGAAVDPNSLLPIVAGADAQNLEMIDDPLDFLKSVYKDPYQDKKLRIYAASLALPYVHGKIAEGGKKQTKVNDAKDQAKGGGKFGTLDSQLPS